MKDDWLSEWARIKRKTFCASLGGLMHETGGPKNNRLFIAYREEDSELLPFVPVWFKKYIFGVATCIKCAEKMNELRFEPRLYPEFGGGKNPLLFVVCKCGMPIWRQNILGLSMHLGKAQNRWDRQQRVKEAEGNFTDADIKKIHSEQKGRCYYCKRKFTLTNNYTIDHAISLLKGGSHWPENIRLACRSCNSKKGSMSERKFIKLLADEHIRKLQKQTQRLRIKLRELQKQLQ